MSTFGKDYRASEPPVLVQWPTNKVSLEDKLHDATLYGKLQKIKDIAARGVNIDAFNEDGQTPLFCAAFKGLADVVGVLLSLGAKPNARCQPEGYTAVHGACYGGSASILKMLIQAGGDLRICDHKRRTPIAWSVLQSDSSRIQAIRNVIESARVCTTETSGLEMLKEMQSNLSPRTSTILGNVIRNIFRKSVVSKDSRSRLGFLLNMDELNNGIHHTGFGKVYFGNGERCAGLIGLPYVSEVSDLEDEKRDEAPSWQCGKFTSFNAKMWTSRKTEVSTRELYTKSGPYCIPDILINDLEIRSKLHHPNLLMLLGVCQTNHCDSISLVYERVNIGSLYSVLHVEQKQLTARFATDVVIQMCDALEYVHSMKMVHCGLSSHAVILVANGVAKLSCFEYCLPENMNSEAAVAVRHPILTSDAHLNVLRHWLAPEVLLRQQFSVKADVYALSCVMWELCNLDIPWRTFTLQSMRHLYSSSPNEPLPINKAKVPHLWYHLLSLGLKPRRDSRDLDIAEIKDMMLLSKKSQLQDLSRNKYFGVQKTSATSLPRSVDSDEGIGAVDDGGYPESGKIVYRTSSATSLHNADMHFIGSSPVFFKERGESIQELHGLIPVEGQKLRMEEAELPAVEPHNSGHQGGDETSEKDGHQPQGILKKFGITRQSKSNMNSQACQTTVAPPAADVDVLTKPAGEKATQTEKSTDKDSTQIANVSEPPKKPKRIGAIMSLGMGWTKPPSKSGSKAKNCKGTQTGVASSHLRPQIAAHDASPSPVHSPTSASTPMWTSFSSSKEPIEIFMNPESQAARRKIKEKLNKLLELRQAGYQPRNFYSLRFPKKASYVKPASHFIEGVSSAAVASANANEFWNYMTNTSLNSNTTADKALAPAIKPAGHALTLEKPRKVMGQKVNSYTTNLKQTFLGSLYAKYSTRVDLSEENLYHRRFVKSHSHLDLPTAIRDDMVRAGFVFETIDKFNAYAKGMMRRCFSYSRMPSELRRAIFQPQRYFSQPLDFQRQRVPWEQSYPQNSRSDCGDYKTSSTDLMDLGGPPNPFQQHNQSIGIQCRLSPSSGVTNESSGFGQPQNNFHLSVNCENGQNNDDDSDFSEKVSSDTDEVVAATMNSLVRNLELGNGGTGNSECGTSASSPAFNIGNGGSCVSVPKTEKKSTLDRSYVITTDPVNQIVDIPCVEPELSALGENDGETAFVSALTSPKTEAKKNRLSSHKGSSVSIREDGDRGDLSSSKLSLEVGLQAPDAGSAEKGHDSSPIQTLIAATAAGEDLFDAD